MPKITPFLWSKVPLDEPIAYYGSIFEDFEVHHESPRSASFTIHSQRFHALHGGPEHDFSEAVSFFIDCEEQEEVDREKAGRVTQAMLQMSKIDVSELDRAATPDNQGRDQDHFPTPLAARHQSYVR